MRSVFLLILLVLGGISGGNCQLEDTEEFPPETKENLIKVFNAKIKEERDLFFNTIKQLTKEIKLGETYNKEYQDNKLLDVSNDTEKTRMSIAKYLDQLKTSGDEVIGCIKQNAEVLQKTDTSFKSCEPKNIFKSTMSVLGSLKDKYIQVQMVLPTCLTTAGDNVANLKQCLEYSIGKVHEDFVDDMSSKTDTVSDFKDCIDEIVTSIRNRNASVLNDVKLCEKIENGD